VSFPRSFDVLEFCVHDAGGELLAAAVHVEDAAYLASRVGEGATVRLHGRVVWTDGQGDVGRAAEAVYTLLASDS
jgi:hypothetical protein